MREVVYAREAMTSFLSCTTATCVHATGAFAMIHLTQWLWTPFLDFVFSLPAVQRKRNELLPPDGITEGMEDAENAEMTT